MNKKNINICYCCDRNYVDVVCVSMISVILNLNRNYNATFYVLYNGLRHSINKFKKIESRYKCKIVILNVRKYRYLFKHQHQSKFQLNYISITTLYRLLMFKIIDHNIGKIIYIDSDVIVDTDLSVVLENFNSDKMFGAVVEIQATKYRYFILKHLNRYYSYFHNLIENYHNYPYFNAGFYIADLTKCNQANVFEEFIKFLDKFPNPSYADQDVLNAIFGQKYRNLTEYLDPSFNVFCNMNYYEFIQDDYYYKKEEIIKALLHPKIYHYGGVQKPWIYTSLNYNNIWWDYASKTNYFIYNNKRKDKIIYKLFSFIPIYKKDF